MPLLDHLREFRNRLMKSLLGIVLAAVVGWYFYQSIIRLLTLPFCDLGTNNVPSDGECGDLYVNGILGPFNLQVKTSLLTGVILAAPIWMRLSSFCTLNWICCFDSAMNCSSIAGLSTMLMASTPISLSSSSISS